MTGSQIGRLSLTVDALYCAVLGVGVLAGASRIAPLVALPTLVVGLVGGAVVGWAAAVAWMVARLPLRTALRIVMVANLVAAVAIAAFSVTVAGVFVLLAVVAIAIDVGAFAGSQAFALRRLRVSGWSPGLP